jgi:hypothetical protein
MNKGKWAAVIVAAFVLCVAAAMGVTLRQARAEGGVSGPTGAVANIGGPTAAVMGSTWSVIAGPVTKGGDVVGYNIYVFQEKTGILWAWESGAARELIRIPTREQEGMFDSGRPRGAVR